MLSLKFVKISSKKPLSRGFASLQIANPANGEVFQTLETDTASSVAAKFKTAKKAQSEWQAVPLDKKLAMISSFSNSLVKNMDELAQILTREMGKPIGQSKNELRAMKNRIEFFLEHVPAVLSAPTARRKNEEVRYEPLGTIANVSAWNYPYFVGSNAYVPALLTGNTVLYKPSEYATLTGLKVAELLHAAGVPKEVFIPLVGKGDVGSQLLEQDIDGVFFTGSLETGKKIASAVAPKMIKIQLELGGKDPTYVMEDADVVKAAKSLADGAMYNTGQSCCSVERIYVHTSVYKQFVEEFVNEVKTFVVGDPLSEKTYIGPLTMTKQPKFLENQVKDAVSKGAKVLLGGKIIKQKGNWFEPTVLVNVNHKMDVMVEESFGPIIGIQEVKSEEEAVALMNDTKYGLTAGVYTRSQANAERILKKVNAGTVYWNACDRVSPYLPWSGRKGSGIGSTLGLEGITTFLRPKAWHLMG